MTMALKNGVIKLRPEPLSLGKNDSGKHGNEQNKAIFTENGNLLTIKRFEGTLLMALWNMRVVTGIYYPVCVFVCVCGTFRGLNRGTNIISTQSHIQSLPHKHTHTYHPSHHPIQLQ